MPFSFRRFLVILMCIPTFHILPLHSQSDSQQSVMKVDQNESAIRVLVTDAKHQTVTDVNRADFRLTQHGKLLAITSAHLEDTPTCIGLLLDKSGSMHTKNPIAISSVTGFVTASNPEDKFFVVIFNDKAYIDQDFTNDISKIQKAIAWHEARGGTALYDTVVASGDHLMQNKDCQRRILIVLTDGGDNMSRRPLRLAIDSLKKMQGISMRLVMITDQ